MGAAVASRMWTRRVACSMAARTCMRAPVGVVTAKKSIAMIASAYARRNADQLVVVRRGTGPIWGVRVVRSSRGGGRRGLGASAGRCQAGPAAGCGPARCGGVGGAVRPRMARVATTRRYPYSEIRPNIPKCGCPTMETDDKRRNVEQFSTSSNAFRIASDGRLILAGH